MQRFLLTGVDQHGQRTTHAIDADSVRSAYDILEARGYRQISLETDDVASVAYEPPNVDRSTQFEPMSMLNPHRLRFLWFMTKHMTRRIVIFILPGVAYLAYEDTTHHPWFWFGATLATVVLTSLTASLLLSYTTPLIKLFPAEDARAWGRWDVVLSRTAALHGRVPTFHLASLEAVALAGLGRLEEGLERLKPFEHGNRPPRWLVLAKVSEACHIAGDTTRALEVAKHAHQFAPHNPLCKLVYAHGLLVTDHEANRTSNTDLAGELIRTAKRKRILPDLKPLIPLLEGIASLHRGQPKAATSKLLRAKRGFKRFAAIAPIHGMNRDVTDAYLAIAYARLGQMDRARELAHTARRRLVAIGSRHLLAQLDQALGTEPFLARAVAHDSQSA